MVVASSVPDKIRQSLTQLSRDVRKPTMWFPILTCTVMKKGHCTFRVAKTKALIRFAVTANTFGFS